MPVQMSVPPENEAIWIPPPTWSWIQRKPLAANGDPVEPMAPIAVRSSSLARRQPGLLAGRDVRGGHAEQADPVPLGELPERHQVGVAGAAVVDHHRRTDQQAADQEVPHHPAGGGEPQEPVTRPEIPVQAQRFQVLQQDPADRLDDRLGQPGGARRVQHPQRRGERHRGEIRFGRRDVSSSQVIIPSGVGVPMRRNVHGPGERGQRRRGSSAPCRRRGTPGRRSGSRRPRAAPSGDLGEPVDDRRRPKSGEHDDHTAPSAAVARNPTSACSELGTSATTRSPAPTPSGAGRPARRRPARVSSASVTSCSLPSSVTTMTAGSVVRCASEAAPSACSA